MALRDTLVYESDNGPLTNFGLLFPVVCFVFESSQALSELSYPWQRPIVRRVEGVTTR